MLVIIAAGSIVAIVHQCQVTVSLLRFESADNINIRQETELSTATQADAVLKMKDISTLAGICNHGNAWVYFVRE
jgi:hypothetical protein